MLFDEEKKGPSEFTTRNIVTSLLFTWLKSAPIQEKSERARILLSYLRDPEPEEEKRPVGFVLEMRRERPYRVWSKEVVNVTKEVFWIFLHNTNVIARPPNSASYGSDTYIPGNNPAIPANFDASNPHHVYMIRHFPQELPPVGTAPYVGGVEWDATNYLASHLDLVNGILASLPTKGERDALRAKLEISGWERCMGGTLRTCKEKFYGGVHAGLKCWVAAATEDEWETKLVRNGPSAEDRGSPIRKSSKKQEDAPRIEMPKFDFGLGDQREEMMGMAKLDLNGQGEATRAWL
jgi:hypothetical protein